MSTVRTPRTRFSGVAKRARNSAAASLIAAGRSPRGQVELASSNSSNGRSPTESGLTSGTSTIAIAPPSSRRARRRLRLARGSIALAAMEAIVGSCDDPVDRLAANDVVTAAASVEDVGSGPADERVLAPTAVEAIAARAAVQAVPAGPTAKHVMPAAAEQAVDPLAPVDVIVAAETLDQIPARRTAQPLALPGPEYRVRARP